MTRDSLIALGKEFRRLGMTQHVEQLAAHYRSNQGHRAPYAWDDAHVLDWMKRLRIPPYQDALPVRPRNSQCPEGAEGDPHTVCAFPGGWEVECLKCRRKWLEMETETAPGPVPPL